MDESEAKGRRLSANAYADLAEHMRLMADRASAATRGEFRRLAALYDRLAERSTRRDYGQPAPPPLVSYKGLARLPLEETYFHFNHASITTHAPSAPGIYALWNQDAWVYVGECEDLRHRLLDHVSNEQECIGREQPTTFGFELIEDPLERLARQAALIRELMPIC